MSVCSVEWIWLTDGRTAGPEPRTRIRSPSGMNPCHPNRTNLKGRFFTVFTYKMVFRIIEQNPTIKHEGPSSTEENMDAAVGHMNDRNRSSAIQSCDQQFLTPSSSPRMFGRVLMMGSLSRRSNGQFSAQISLYDPVKRPLRTRAKHLTRPKRTIPSSGRPSLTIPLLARQNLPSGSLRGPCRPAAFYGRAFWPIVPPYPRNRAPFLSPSPPLLSS